MTNEPKNQIESNWFPLLGAVTVLDVRSGNFWLTATLRSLLDGPHSITTLEDNLARAISLTWSLLIQRFRNRFAAGDTSLSSTWTPQHEIGSGEHPVLKAYLQVNGIPLLVGSLSVLVLCAVSIMCVAGHGVNDNIVRDGGVIDLVSLLHNSALPEIVAGPEEDGRNENIGDAMFTTRSNRAKRVMVASVFQTTCDNYIIDTLPNTRYGYGSLDTPERIQQRGTGNFGILGGPHNKPPETSLYTDRPRTSSINRGTGLPG